MLDQTCSCCLQEWYPKSAKTTPNTSSDSKSEDEFLTASECTCTPPSRASSFQTASEGGAASPWWEVEPNSDSDEKAKNEARKTAERIPRTVCVISSIFQGISFFSLAVNFNLISTKRVFSCGKFSKEFRSTLVFCLTRPRHALLNKT